MLSSQLRRPAKAREIIMAVVVMLLMFFLSNRHFIAPKQAEATELMTTLTDIQTSIQQKKVENDALRQAQAAVQEKEQETIAPQNLSVDLKQSYKYEDITMFLQTVTQPMFRLSVNIDAIKHDAAVVLAGYKETKFTLIASGDYSKTVGFLKKLEEVSVDTHQVGLDTIQINVEKGGENVSLSLAGSFYQLEE